MRPLPHVYQADPQGTAQPLVPQEELRQEAATSMGTAGLHSSVRVQELASISQKHVICCLGSRALAVTMPTFNLSPMFRHCSCFVAYALQRSLLQCKPFITTSSQVCHLVKQPMCQARPNDWLVTSIQMQMCLAEALLVQFVSDSPAFCLNMQISLLLMCLFCVDQ